MRVLLVEDNEMNRDMLSRRLSRRGFDVLIAVDGAQGIQVAKTELPDLILMDMSLPVVDGWDATRQLKTDTQTQSIPVIALTDRKSTRLNSSHGYISYAVFCLKKKKKKQKKSS